jgi:checkpoint serine/threonine-protein kinase
MKDDGVFTLSNKKPGIDTLKRDPLRNHAMPPPELPSTSNAKPKVPLGSSQSKSGDLAASTSSRPKTSKSLPATKPNERLQIDISLLILPDGTEIHPLERRARDFGVADKRWPMPGPEQTPNPKAAAQNRTQPKDSDHEIQVDFEGTKPMTMSSTMTGFSRDATVTINTKEALMAVYGMYNSPTKSLTSGKAFSAAMIDPQNADFPTPMANPASVAPRDENAGTARKPGKTYIIQRHLSHFISVFQPFTDGPTPSASRISSENTRTPGPVFRTPGGLYLFKPIYTQMLTLA